MTIDHKIIFIFLSH